MSQITYRETQNWMDPTDTATIATLHMHCPRCHDPVMFVVPVDDPLCRMREVELYQRRVEYLQGEVRRLHKVIDALATPTRFYYTARHKD